MARPIPPKPYVYDLDNLPPRDAEVPFKPDSFYTLIVKVHGNDVTKQDATKTWFWMTEDVAVEQTLPYVAVTRDVNGRNQTSYYPWSEIVRFDLNSPSKNYFEAMDAWTRHHYGVSYDEYTEMKVRTAARHSHAGAGFIAIVEEKNDE